MIPLQTPPGAWDSWRSGVRQSPNLSCMCWKDEMSAKSLPNPHQGHPANSTAPYQHSCAIALQMCGLPLCLKFGINTSGTGVSVFIFATWVSCLSYHLGKMSKRGGGLPSPASVWRWGEVNWAVRTAVNVNLVKANKVDGMKNGSQLIHTFMSLGWFNLIDLTHAHTYTQVLPGSNYFEKGFSQRLVI